MKWTKDYRVGEKVEVLSHDGKTWHPAYIARKTHSGQIIVEAWGAHRAIGRKGEIRKRPGGAPKLSEAAIERIINDEAPIVDGAGLEPEAHATDIAEALDLNPKQVEILAAELNNALVPARHWTKQNPNANRGVQRALRLVAAIVKRNERMPR